MNIAVAILGKCKNYPNCRVSKNCITPAPPLECRLQTEEIKTSFPDYGERCEKVRYYWNAKQTFEQVVKGLSGTVNTNRDLGLFVIKEGTVGKDWATFYDGNIIRSYCSSKTLYGHQIYRIIYRYNT